MRISELVERLEALKEKYGDLPMYLQDWGRGLRGADIEAIGVQLYQSYRDDLFVSVIPGRQWHAQDDSTRVEGQT